MAGSHITGPQVSEQGFSVGTKASNTAVVDSSRNVTAANLTVVGTLTQTGNPTITGNLTLTGDTLLKGTFGTGTGGTTFTVAADGALAIATDKLTVSAAGAVVAASTVKSTGDLTVGDSKFVVTAASGNTLLKGTLGAGTNGTTFTVAADGALAIATDKFTVSAAGITLIKGTLTVGVDATGHDVKFFGDTSGAYFLYDESANGVVLTATHASQTLENQLLDVDFTTDSTFLTGTNLTYSGARGSAALNITGTFTGKGGYHAIYYNVAHSGAQDTDGYGVIGLKGVVTNTAALTDGEVYGAMFIAKHNHATNTMSAQASLIGVEGWAYISDAGQVATAIGGNFAIHNESTGVAIGGSVHRVVQLVCDNAAGANKADESTGLCIWNMAGTWDYGIKFVGSGSGFTTLIYADGTTAALASKGIFIGADANVDGSGIPLDAANYVANGLYADDGGVAMTAGYTECFTARHLFTEAVTGNADVSAAAIHGDMNVRASYTGAGGLSGIWGGFAVPTGVTVTTSAGHGDVAGGHFSVDIPSGATLAASSYAAGVSVGGNLGGTLTGLATAFRIRVPSAGTWSGALSLATNCGAYQASAATGGTSQYLKVYIAGVLYTAELTTAA
jgi:hypothetical protein